MSSKPRVAVVGAGLGGTTAAILLQRAGYECVVYEQAPALVRIGAGINLAPNSTRILRAMGLGPVLQQYGIQPKLKFSREWDTGRVLFTIPIPELEKEYAAPFFAFHRGDLQQLLTAALKPETIQFGKRLITVEEAGGSLKLVFADGSSVSADLVIGADGVHSAVQRIVQGPQPLLIHGLVGHRSIYPVALLGNLKIADNTKWWGDDRFILVYFMSEKRDEVYFITGVPEPWDGTDWSPRAADLDQVRAYFKGFHPEVQRILDACPGVTKWPLLERDPYAVWSRGRIALIGDACHPTTPFMGQGAGLAIEDAAVLVRALERFGGQDPEAAFKLYQSHRFERASRVQLESRKNEWTRTGMDHRWLYGYDALTAPLVPAPALSTTASPPVPAI